VIIDASALLAIVLDEADGRRYADAIVDSDRRLMPTVTWFEASLVLDTRGDEFACSRLQTVVGGLGITFMPFTSEHAEKARVARRTYGRGRHAAQLNFGDCMVYAVAKHEGEPLLFKGNDFSQADIEPALKR
jgi:ribonuclease VapC